MAARVSNTPKAQIGPCLVSCAFGNSTGLVMTLLTVIHDQFKATTELGSVDATAFLSVYLLLYPVLQWGIGGWLLAPNENEEEQHDIQNKDNKLSETARLGNLSNGKQILNGFNPSNPDEPSSNSPNITHRYTKCLHLPHILNNDHFQFISSANQAGDEEFGGVAPIRIVFGKNDEEHRNFLKTGRIDSSGSNLATMIKELSFVDLCLEGSSSKKSSSTSLLDQGEAASYCGVTSNTATSPTLQQLLVHENTPLIDRNNEFTSNELDRDTEGLASKKEMKMIHESDLTPLTATLFRVATKVFQP